MEAMIGLIFIILALAAFSRLWGWVFNTRAYRRRKMLKYLEYDAALTMEMYHTRYLRHK